MEANTALSIFNLLKQTILPCITPLQYGYIGGIKGAQKSVTIKSNNSLWQSHISYLIIVLTSALTPISQHFVVLLFPLFPVILQCLLGFSITSFNLIYTQLYLIEMKFLENSMQNGCFVINSSEQGWQLVPVSAHWPITLRRPCQSRQDGQDKFYPLASQLQKLPEAKPQ